MKKYLFWLFGVALALAACNNNDPEQNLKLDDYEYLVESLMRFDDNGEITGYMIGDNLNEADPTEISIPVKDFDEAVAIFRTILPQDAVVKQEGKTYTWAMSDSIGQSEGELVLEEDTVPGGIACFIIKKGPKIPKAPARNPKIPKAPKGRFIPESAWPENSGAAEEILEQDYYLGAIVNKSKDEGFGSGTFVVIAPWTPQECGLMIQLASSSSYFEDMPKKKCSGVSTLHRVYRELHKDNNYQEIFVTKGQEVNWPNTLNGWYLTKTKKGAAYYCVNLETNGEKFYNPDKGRYIEKAPAHRAPAASDKFRMAYCYCFKPDGDKIKFW